MDLSIIIVNWNTKDHLKNCLASLRQHNCKSLTRTIVVDNASQDYSAEMVKTEFPEVGLVNSGGNIGFAKANNLAIPKCDAPFILFLNPDTLIVDDSLQLMTDFLNKNINIGAVGCKMKDADGLIQPLGLQWFPTPLTELFSLLFISTRSRSLFNKYLPIKDPQESGLVSKLYGGCLMVRREVLTKVGYFDERFFMYGEDVDLCRRILEGGWKLYYLSEAEIIHLCGGASGKTISQFATLMKCESISKLMEKYYGKKGLILYKLAILSGSQMRLLLLRLLKFIMPVSSRRRMNYDESLGKYRAMVKWSLNLQKPIVKE